MKSATLPSLRVEPEFRQAVEAVLEQGETLSAFVEASVRSRVQYRRMQKEFIDRGLASLAAVEQGERTYTSEEVIEELEEIIARAERRDERMG